MATEAVGSGIEGGADELEEEEGGGGGGPPSPPLAGPPGGGGAEDLAGGAMAEDLGDGAEELGTGEAIAEGLGGGGAIDDRDSEAIIGDSSTMLGDMLFSDILLSTSLSFFLSSDFSL